MTAKPVAIGLGVSPGVATGVVVFGKDRAESLASRGVSVILVRPGLQRSDTPTLAASAGLIASREGMTGIGAMIARGLGKPCVTRVQDEIDRETWEPTSLAGTIREGMAVTIDGDSGAIYQGEIPLVTPGIHDDPHLSRYADLIGRLDPDSFVDDELSAFWRLRDTLSHGSPPYPPLGRRVPASSGERGDVPGPAAGSFVGFVQPSTEIILEVLHRMHGEFNSDDGLVAWGLLHHLNRLLLGAAGAGNHHLAMRPLLDPMMDLPAEELDARRPGDNDLVYQVVGVEFFGINRLLPNLLPWGSIQWWALLHSERDFLWRLDRTYPEGESLIPGTSRLRSFLVVLDGTLLSIADTRRCYNDLRKRDLSWDWYERHNTSYQEMVKSLRGVRDGLPIDPGTTGKLVDAGLLTSSTILSPAGLALLGNESTKDRRSITFRWREANEGN